MPSSDEQTALKNAPRNVPFSGNHDGVSCGQCVYKMALSYFHPDRDWPFARMDEFCGAVPGKYTWPYKPLIELSDLGFDIVTYSTFDTVAFLENPEAYLTLKYGAAGCKDNFENSDMDAVLKQAQIYLEHLNAGKIKRHNANYTPRNLRQLIDDGYLAVIWVNSAKLNGEDGYTGHFILVHDYDGSDFIAHDPGGNDADGKPENQIPDRRIQDDALIAAASPRVAGETSILIAIKYSNLRK